MTKDEALKMAYKAEETGNLQDLVDAVNALMEALEQPAQEPVAWLYEREDGAGVLSFEKNLRLILKGYKEIPLYTHEGNANDNS